MQLVARKSSSASDSLGTLILAVLENETAHGYAIAAKIRALSDHKFTAGEGTLYPALRKLEAEKYIQSEWIISPSGPAKREYSITEQGRKELEARRQAWQTYRDSFDKIITRNPLHEQ